MLIPEHHFVLKFILPGDYFDTQAIHTYCVAKCVQYSRDSHGRRVASMIYTVIVTNVNIQFNDEMEYESATVTGSIVGQSKYEKEV